MAIAGGGTLTRSYHNHSPGSSMDLPNAPNSGRQRTPQVVYTGPRGSCQPQVQLQQPTSSLAQTMLADYGTHARHASPYQSTVGLTPTPPPSTVGVMDGNRTLSKRQGSALANHSQGQSHPLTSFSGMAAAVPPPPPMPPGNASPMTHVVRPVTVTTAATPRQAKPAGIVIGSTKTFATVLPNSARPQNFVSMAPSCSDSASQKDTDSDLQVRAAMCECPTIATCSRRTVRRS